MWMQIPYFCGQLAPCWDTGSQWALERAKSNLVNEYFLVGMNEQMGQFVEMLEVHVPHIFKVNSGELRLIPRDRQAMYAFETMLTCTSDFTCYKHVHNSYLRVVQQFTRAKIRFE